MSGTPPDTHRSSVQQRVRDAICTLLCRPTRPPSPLPSPPDLPLGYENLSSGHAPPEIPVEGDPSVESSQPGEPSTEGSSAQSPSAPCKPPKNVAMSAHEATDTALDPTSSPPTPIHDIPATNMPYMDDDVQVHAQPTPSIDSSLGDAQHLANAASVGSNILSPTAPETPLLPDEENSHSESRPSIAEQKSPLTNGETQGQLYMTNVVIALNVGSDENIPPLRLRALCPLGAWTLNECIALPLGTHEICLVVKDEDEDDIGYAYFEQEDVQSTGESARPFVTHKSQLNLSMSWKVSHDATQSPNPNLLQASARGIIIGNLLDSQETDLAMLNHLLEDPRYQEEDTVIGTGQVYNSEGVRLLRRFESTGHLDDINGSIFAFQRAIEVTPKGHVDLPGWFSNLGASFLRRFECTGDMTNITQAINSQQQAVQLTPQGHENLPGFLNNLGSSFLRHFQHTGDMADMGQAITSQQHAVQMTPQGHAALPRRLNNLCSSLHCRFEHTGDMNDISQAITSQQRAVQLTPQGHPDLPGLLNNLGNFFIYRFERTGDMTDITQAITSQQQAVQLTPQGHAALPRRLNNLGNSLKCCFERTGDMTDISQAITSQQRAVQLTPQGHANLPAFLNNLGNLFSCRFDYTGDMTDISQAITSQQQAVQLTPQGHPDLPTLLNNVGNSFKYRFECTGEMSDITQAIISGQQAVQLIPHGHAYLSNLLNDLGNSLKIRFLQANRNGIGEQQQLEDMHASVDCFRAATQSISGPPTTRLRGAMRWANLLNHHNPESCEVLVPFEAAVNLLTLVAGLERTLEGRHSQLQHVPGVALEAAAAACRLGYPERAVEWLEQGRCLVWGQLNGLRTPMDNLQEKDPQLAQRLTDVAKQLDVAGSTRASVDPSMEMSAKISLEDAAHSHLALAKEWEELISTARHLPGFQSFLLPPPYSTLLRDLPASGPIMVINCHRDRCDALALLHGLDQTLHIPLPDFSLRKANQYRHVLKAGLHSNGVRVPEDMGSLDKKLGGAHGRDITQDWHDETTLGGATVDGVLRSLWYEVAKPILDMLGYSRYDTSSNLVQPRIWWCPTGVMSFLPIHAAGIYGGSNSECLMDYIVSSYTPTVTAITHRVKSSHTIDMSGSGLFLTSQPKAPGAAEILGTTKEVGEVYAKALKKRVRALKCEGDGISVEDCRRYMGEYSCAHLACHASQNASDPFQSRFRLHKGELSLLSIIQMDLQNADLAFLSACQTSTGKEELPDEAVHLAAGMLAAGYRRVVATMWSISDNHAPSVATDFYDYLWDNRIDGTGDGFDASLSAHALHHAVQQLRGRLGNSERDLLIWIPYVLFGY